MTLFIIQTADHAPRNFEMPLYDFQYELIDDIERRCYMEGLDGKARSFEYTKLPSGISLPNKYHTGIPIGSVEFALQFYKEHYGIENILPINIPEELNQHKFLQRKIIPWTVLRDPQEARKLFPGGHFFAKPAEQIKEFPATTSLYDLPIGRPVFISEEIEKIASEWRGFVYKGQLLDCRCYIGNFKVAPDFELIEEMISEYKSAPPAYTIDVGVNNNGTFLIEIHDFFSCGLYGFNSHLLINMCVATHNYLLESNAARIKRTSKENTK